MPRQAAGRNQTQQAPAPPEPLTEFQKFAAITTGQILPIFGSDLFRRVPSTFAPLDMTPVPSDFVLGPADELRIRIWGQVNFQNNVRIDRAGEIFLPQIGSVHVAGIPFSALDAQLRAAIGRVYHNFDLTADLGQIHAIQVYLSGQARRPGVYTVSSLSSLVDTLFVSGGPSLEGTMRRIELRRGSAVVTEFDLYDLLTRGDKSKDVKLQSGDVIFIPPVGSQAAVTGSVRNPAIYELRENEPLSVLLADAGGVSPVAAEARVSIERIDDHRDRHTMEVTYDASGLVTPLSDGDLIRVYSIVPLYRKTVILRGNIANPGRFAWHPGMHISDLIPDKESLITRNYWWRRSQLGLPAPDFEPTPGFADTLQPAENRAVTMKTPTFEELNSSNQTGGSDSQNPSAAPRATSGSPAGWGSQNPSAAQRAGGGSLPGWDSQNLSAAQRAGSGALAENQTSVSARVPDSAQRTEVLAFAPDLDWNYAVIERLDPDTLKTNLIPFDLGKLVLQHDASMDLELQAGDILSIFSEADIRVPLAQQTKRIRLDGEFVHAGVYVAQEGETLRQLVERAGGFTPDAYLYGSEFTRESTRALQQTRIDDYVQTQRSQIRRNSIAMAAASTSSSPTGDLAQSTERDLMASLGEIRATGRIVLRFTADSIGANSLPDITLEDGDRFVVPPIPATVNVVGAVYDQSSFLYAPGNRTGSYMQMAGGPNREADRKHEFIIRADGEVISRDTGTELWAGKFYNVSIHPGDTIVIPEKIFKPSALRGVLDWSQVFSQFALGAAALTVIQ